MKYMARSLLMMAFFSFCAVFKMASAAV